MILTGRGFLESSLLVWGPGEYLLRGATSRKGFFSTLRSRHSRFLLAKRPEAALGDTFVGVLVIIAGQMDMFPG